VNTHTHTHTHEMRWTEGEKERERASSRVEQKRTQTAGIQLSNHSVKFRFAASSGEADREALGERDRNWASLKDVLINIQQEVGLVSAKLAQKLSNKRRAQGE
jgi:hypothetical protein